MAEWFAAFSRRVSRVSGHYVTFIVALGLVIVWAVSGPFFQFAETWQLVINTGTTIITFLMVFVLQSTQNRDAEAVHIKLDEIISALDRASNQVMAAEDETEEELEQQLRDYGTRSTQ
jgi:low affinity Fe/Cu permease